MTTTTRTPPVRCPACDHLVDAATSTQGEATPSPGDLSVCVYCAAVLEFADDLRLTLMTQEQVDALEPEIRAAVTSARSVVRLVKLDLHLDRGGA